MRISALLFTGGLLLSPLAFGQSVDTQQIPDLPVRAVPPGSPTDHTVAQGWNFTLGGGVSYAPRYEGAAHNRRRFMPLLELSYNSGKLFISPLRGIGYNFSDSRNVQYGLRLAMAMGRRQNVDPHLNGMGNISRTAEFGPYLNWRIAPWYVSGGLTTSSHGSHAELGGGINLPLSAADRMRIGTNLNWGNQQYNQTYFGITPAQATASNGGLPTSPARESKTAPSPPTGHTTTPKNGRARWAGHSSAFWAAINTARW